MRAAFYKGTRPGWSGLYNRLVRWWTRSPYSHCELVFSDGMAASASYLDGGVRFKEITFDAERWDFIELRTALEPAARAWFQARVGQPYDILGNIHFVIGPVGDKKDAWFCDEAMAAALGFERPARYDPGTLCDALKWGA